MTRKDYKLIAEGLANAKPTTTGPELATWQRTVACVSRSLIGTNDRFDRNRFEQATGLYEEPK